MGLTAKDDRLPEILLHKFKEGGSANRTPSFKKLKSLFYKYKDWNSETGIPNDSKLRFLGLEKLINK